MEEDNTMEKLIPGAKVGVLWRLSLNCTLSAFIFGYQLGCFNITQSSISDILGFGSNKLILVTLATTLTPIGAFAGSLSGGSLSNKLGRKRFLYISDIVTIVGCAINVIPFIPTFMIGRLVGGFTAGASATVCPIYITEYSPKELRGRLGSLFQFQVTLGIVLAYAISLPILYVNSYYYIVVFALPVIPAVMQMFIFTTIYRNEPPPYCFRKDRIDEARKALGDIYDEDYIEEELSKLRAEAQGSKLEVDGTDTGVLSEGATYAQLFTMKKYRKEMTVGNLLSFFQQFTGVNAIIFYSTAMFVKAGEADIAPFLTVLVGFVNMVATMGGMPFVDKYGRKSLLIVGYIGMFFSEIAVALFAMFEVNIILQTFFVMLFIVFFEISIGPIMWLYAAEIMSDKGMSIAATVNWTIVIIVSAISDIMFSSLGISITLLIYSAFTFTGLLFVIFFVFETKGKTREEIKAILYEK